jgi:hypothetical protein
MSALERIKQMHRMLDDLLQLQLDQAVSSLLQDAKYQDPKCLARYEHKVYSQGGEDGAIGEIFKRIGTTNKVFVECAPGNGTENNTLYLLTQGWKGLWIERDAKHISSIEKTFAQKIKSGALVLDPGPALRENIESLLTKAPISPEFDLLSIDIDGNDYWIWKALERHRPRVVVIEYNGVFPPGCEWVMDYDPQTAWDGSSDFGASLTSLELLGAEKGYHLAGCTLTGSNAFFVRGDLTEDRFSSPFTASHHYEPPRYYLTGIKAGHRRAVPRGL